MTEPRRLPEGPRPRCGAFADVGPYVLGALPAAERVAFESHLPTCPECRRAVDELAALPGWLDLVPPEVVGSLVESSGLGLRVGSGVGPDDGGSLVGEVPERLADDLRVDPGPPPALLPDLLRVTQRDARAHRRRAWTASVAVAAVLALTVLVSAGTLHLPWLEPAPDPSAAPTVAAEAIELTPVGDSPVSANIRMQSVAWGTRIDLTCEYGTGATGAAAATSAPGGAPTSGSGGDPYADAAAGRYALVVRDAQGRTEEVATWAAVVGAPMRVPASTVMTREQIVEVELQGSDGAALLRADT